MPVAAQVRHAVETHPALGQLLGQGLVNLRATARYLQDQGMVLPDQSEAVVSALRRLRGGSQVLNGHCIAVLDQARIEVHAPVASITMRHAEGNEGRLDPDLLALLRARWQILSPQGIRLVVPEANLAGAEARILAAPDLQINRGLAEVALMLTPEARRLPGVLALACQRLGAPRREHHRDGGRLQPAHVPGGAGAGGRGSPCPQAGLAVDPRFVNP